ncbi:HYR-like domain-containing protein, partial [Winogradskyella aurantiaca]
MKKNTKKWSLKCNNACLAILLLLSTTIYGQDLVQCGADAYFQTIRLRQNIPGEGQNGDFALYKVDPIAVTFEFIANLSVSDGPDDYAIPSSSSVNSLGVNPDDNQFYFINPSSPYQFYRMSGTGQVTYLGNLTGAISGSNVAGVFDKEGNYYVTGGSKKLFQVDLNTLETTLVMSTGINVSDIAINPDNDLIYGWDQGKRQLNTFDILNQTVSVIGPEANTSEFGTFGALYFLPSGQLIGYGDNTTISGGQEALVDFNLQTGVVTQLGTGPSVSVNDGASCPFTLAIDKDGPETAGLNTTITYTFKIFNRTAQTLHNIFFQDVLQDGLVFNSEPYNISTEMTIFGTSNGQTQTDLVLNNIPIGISTFQIDVFINCDFPDEQIMNQAIIGIDNLDNPISSNDTDTAVIGDPTGTGIQPLELVFPEEVTIEGCTEVALTSETSVFNFNTVQSGNVAEAFNNAENYEILPSLDNVVELTYIDAISPDSNACGVTIERTFSATDNCGRSIEAVQIIKVIDSAAPIAESIPEELSINCEDYDGEAPITPFTAQDNCSGEIIGVPTDTISDGECGNAFTITRSWSFTDDCGNEAISVQTINVIDVTPPVFDLPLPGDITADCNALPDLTLLSATDNCGEVTVEVVESPSDDDCAIIRTWTATDACGNSSEFSQTITVIDEEAPVFVLTDEEDACHTELVNGAFEAIQFNGIISFEQIQQENIPGWSTTATHNTIEIQRSGQVNGTFSHNGNFHFELNGQGLDDLYQSFCTVPGAELTVQFFHKKRRVNDIVDSLELFAGSDLNNLTSLGVYSVTNADGWKENIVSYVVPEGQESTMILFQALTGSTPSVGNLLDDISVSSDRNNFAELPQDITVNCDEIPEPEVLTAEDNCNNVTVVFEEETVLEEDTTESDETNTQEVCYATEVIDYGPTTTSSGGSIPEDRTDPNKALGQPDGSNEPGGFVSLGIGGSITLKMGGPIYDEAGNDIAIDETSFGQDNCSGNNNENALIEVSQDGNTWVSLVEICRDEDVDISGAGLEFVLFIRITDTTTGGGDGFDVDGVSTLNGCGSSTTPTNNQCSSYNIVRTWTAEDFCGNSTSHTQTITVIDNEAPVFNENLPSDISVECDAIPNAVNLTAFDACSDATVEFEEVITDGTCSYEIVRIWTASDACGNEREHVQTITVIDETAPVLESDLETNISAECGEIPEVPELVFSDSCSENIEVVFTEDDSQSNTFNDFEIFRTWTVTDECGNSAEYTQTVSVQIVNTIEAFDSRICNVDGPVDLFNFLQGEFDTNGVWTVVDGDPSLLTGSVFDPGSIEEDSVYTFNYALTDVSCPVERNLNITIDNCVVLSCGAEDVIISKTVTANGDGLNDVFRVSGIEDCGFVIEVQL